VSFCDSWRSFTQRIGRYLRHSTIERFLNIELDIQALGRMAELQILFDLDAVGAAVFMERVVVIDDQIGDLFVFVLGIVSADLIFAERSVEPSLPRNAALSWSSLVPTPPVWRRSASTSDMLMVLTSHSAFDAPLPASRSGVFFPFTTDGGMKAAWL
jgi:hypothetical protein